MEARSRSEARVSASCWHSSSWSRRDPCRSTGSPTSSGTASRPTAPRPPCVRTSPSSARCWVRMPRSRAVPPAMRSASGPTPWTRRGSSAWPETATRRSQRGAVRSAASQLRRALELWRGQPFEGAQEEGALLIEAQRLEDLRLSALEDRIEADLALGQDAELVDELEAAAPRRPVSRTTVAPADARPLSSGTPDRRPRRLPTRARAPATKTSASSPARSCSVSNRRSCATRSRRPDRRRNDITCPPRSRASSAARASSPTSIGS